MLVFDRWFDSWRWWLCALSGLLLVASFAPFDCVTCGWIALIPAWWVITRSERARRHPMRHGYLIGLIYFGGTFWWVSDVTAIGMVCMVLYLALYPAVWFLFVARLIRRRDGDSLGRIAGQALAAAALWVMLEWWRGWFLTGFNWNELGVSQAHSPVYRQLAAYGGVPLISFLLVTVNILWAEGLLGIVRTLQEKRVMRPSGPFAIALLLVAATFALGWGHLQRHSGDAISTGFHFACIQPNIPQIPYDPKKPYIDFMHSEADALDKTVQLSHDAIAAGDKPQLLIWPEATIEEGIFRDRPLNRAVIDICHSYSGYFLLGAQDFNDGEHKIYNSAYLFTPGGDTYEEYRKTHLVIVGEFLPFGDTFPVLRQWAGVGMDFTPGPGPKVFPLPTLGLKFAPLICFEDTLSDVVNKATRLGPDFFVTITNDGWYTGWYATWGVRQHLDQAVFRCVEHDRPMIRCANTGISCIVDQRGAVADRYTDAADKEIDVGGVFAGRLQFYPARPTLYESWGDWIVLISSLVSVMLGLWYFFSPRAR